MHTSTGFTTEELARAIGGKPTSIRVRLSQTGSYHGVQPRRLVNGRLLWPADAVEQLTTNNRKSI